MKFKKILSTALMTAICLVPFGAKAVQIDPLQNLTQNPLSFLQPEQKQEHHNQNFMDAQPAAVEVAPIENVEDYLPDKIFPSAISTSELLDLVAPRTDTFTVVDLETGKSFEAVRYGGNKHLDTEPKTIEDTTVLNSLENQSWNRRPIALYINGEFYAASMHTMDHGNGFVSSNNFNGHICIHVLGSRTHGSNRVCNLHQDMIQKSLNTDITTLAQTVMNK